MFIIIRVHWGTDSLLDWGVDTVTYNKLRDPIKSTVKDHMCYIDGKKIIERKF